MKRGKRICSQLKAIRRSIAEENNIPLDIPECTYEGECRGTCPRCESEVKYLEAELSRRARMGFAATVAGVAVTLSACDGEHHPLEVTGISPVEDTLLHVDTTSTEKAAMPKCLANKAKMEELPDSIVLDGLCIITDDQSSDSTEAVNKNNCLVGEEELYEGEEAFFAAEVDPEFPGGLDALAQYLKDHIQYPEKAKSDGIEGTVYVGFVVEKDGSIVNIRILRDIGYGCGDEVVRVVRSMPRWSPGYNHGRAVRTYFNIPFKYELTK